jgi:hypothetical protein
MKSKIVVVAGLLLSVAFNSNAQSIQSLKDKVVKKDDKGGKGVKTIKPYTKDFTDAKGISGTMLCSPAMLTGKDQFGRDAFQNIFKWEYIHEESGSIVVKLNIYYNEAGGKIEMKMNEKYNESYATKAFSNNDGLIIEIDKDVYALYDNETKKVTHVFAKDEAQFAVYDIETAAAKYDQKMSEIKTKESAAESAKWMKNETYKLLVGKVNFVDNYSKLSYNRVDAITEKPTVYVSTYPMGLALYNRAYFKTPITALCGADCEFNTVYEMEGIKTSRVELAKKSSKWSQNFKKREANDYFFTSAYTMQDDKVWDYAYIYCLYQNKDKFVDGKSYKMKVSYYANRDGVDKDLMAEGTITLVYKKENKDKLDLIFQQMEDFLAQ